MGLLLINNVLRHTYGLTNIRSVCKSAANTYSFKTKYSDTNFVGVFFKLDYDSSLKAEDINLDDEVDINTVNENASEDCFAIEFDKEPCEREVNILKKIREKFAEHDCFVSLYNTSSEESLEI